WHTGSLTAIAISPDSRYIVTGGSDTAAAVWYLHWQTAVKQPAAWDDGALPFAEIFLALRSVGKFPPVKKPHWTEDELRELLREMSLHGYGWLSAAGITNKLNEMAANWKTILSDRRYLFEKEFRTGR
ncbi:MAG: hypothetical protein L7F77_05320, partial [Candidatus Magnetominusculus sp. LBB02]|nr:hypothetical protein [Candidatus Magnetominusculus sp. LBB02]